MEDYTQIFHKDFIRHLHGLQCEKQQRQTEKKSQRVRMERNQILMKEKLGFTGLLKEALKIFYQNPKFIILSFLASLPLFFCMLFHELWFQKTLIEAAKFLSREPEIDNFHFYISYHFNPVLKVKHFIEEFGQAFLQLGLLYLALIHPADLINTIGVVSSASAIYSGEKLVKLREALFKSIENGAFRRSLITSIYVILMASLVFLGLLAVASQACVFIQEPLSWTWSSSIYVLPFIVLFYKYLQWTCLWNLGMVTSILEEKHGVVALGVSAYISRGNRQHGQILTAMFFVWKISLRLMATIYVGFFHKGDERRALIITAIQVFLVCLGNVIKWVIFMVFFYDCKLRFLEKKVDVEEGKKDEMEEGEKDSSVRTATTC